MEKVQSEISEPSNLFAGVTLQEQPRIVRNRIDKSIGTLQQGEKHPG